MQELFCWPPARLTQPHPEIKAPKGRSCPFYLYITTQVQELQRAYTMTACPRTGEPDHVLCRMPNAREPKALDYTVHDVMEEYLKVNGTVSPQTNGRAKALDLESPVLSQLPNVDYIFR